jgi:hypothetical protein
MIDWSKTPEWAEWAAKSRCGSVGFFGRLEDIPEDMEPYCRPGTNPQTSAPESLDFVSGYEELARILALAYRQSARGKGAVRHADGKPWHEQPIITTTQAVGYGFPAGQAMKKIGEARGMMERGETEAAIQELLGAITYTAAAVKYLEGKQ